MRGQSQTAQSLNLLRAEDPNTPLAPWRLGLNEAPVEEGDFCERPYGRYLQGHFFSDWRTLGALYPIFSPAKANGYNDIVIPSHYYYGETKRCGFLFLGPPTMLKILFMQVYVRPRPSESHHERNGQLRS